jgi:hypothetical protein
MQNLFGAFSSMQFFAPVATTVGLALGFVFYRLFRSSDQPEYGDYFSPSYKEARLKFICMRKHFTMSKLFV